MGNTASRENSAKRLLEQGSLTLPLGSQVEKLFHEDFDDDAQAILTPNTPTTPAFLSSERRQKRTSWRNSLDMNKWAPVLPATSNKRDSGHGSSNGTSTEYLSPSSALSILSTRKSSEVLPARQVLSLQAKGGNAERAVEPDDPATRSFDSKSASPQTVDIPSLTAPSLAANAVLPNPINSRSSTRLPEHISPQQAVSRIARRMAANTPTPNDSNASIPLIAGTDTASSKHDSALLSEDISTHDFQPSSLVLDPNHPAAPHLLQRLSAEGGAQQVLSKARERSRSRDRSHDQQRQRKRRQSQDGPRRLAARLDDLTEALSPRNPVDMPARWQQRVTKRLSDQEFSDRHKKRLSGVSVGQRTSWLEGPSAPSSDRED
ncbi:hypothetical protein DOTSEDRAFT_82761 [Dothistroma septosporum NZE10]|uniref:Uncharacterized protein n=1 Tax=Dothistroma septosporum (strain NZE10 / CBS 128990) TaxID=675120 RepID=N1PC95_DOTSN|nr:hypothetical protein DOTSEDRAFT_82761 [Dothistroma septosporum NZE10]